MERSRRAKSDKRSQVSDAIARLREDREGGVGTRAKAYESKQEKRVYDVVDEEKYEQIMLEKNKSVGSFVVDDDGLGYKDDEGEDWFGSEVLTTVGEKSSSLALDRGDVSNPGDANYRIKRKAQKPPEVKAKKRMQQMLLKAPVKMGREEKGSTESSDALLQSILTGIDGPGPMSTKPNSQAQGPGAIVEPDMAFFQFQKELPSTPVALGRSSSVCGEDTPRDDFTFDTPVGVPRDEDPGNGLMALANLVHNRKSASPDPDIDMSVPQSWDQGEHSEAFETPASPTSIPDVQMLSIADDPSAEETRSRRQPQSFPPPKSQSFGPVSGWENIQKNEEIHDSTEVVPWEDDGSLSLVDGETLPFYFVDALEDNWNPGSIFLFGKIPCRDGSQTMSCCAVLRDVDRFLFVVPTAEIFGSHEHQISLLEANAAQGSENQLALVKYLQQLAEPVKAELRGKLLALGVKKFRMKPVKRKYAFEKESVPHGEQYVIKVSCPGAAPLHQLDVKGENYTHVFGLNQTALELILIKRKIMGPSWIGLKRPVRKEARMQRSWCSFEVDIVGHKSLICGRGKQWASMPTPSLRVASINLKTHLNPVTQTNEIVAVSVLYMEAVKPDGPTDRSDWNGRIKHFSGITNLKSQPWPAGMDSMINQQNSSPAGKRNGGNILKTLPSERALLNYFLARLKVIDPDVLVGHNIAAFDMSLLFHRMNANKVDEWSRISRLKRQKYPSLTGGGQMFGGGAGPAVMAALAGRLLCDTYISARELVKEVDYTLTTLAKSLLGEFRNPLTISDVPKLFDSLEGISTLIQHAESDAYLSMGIMFQLSILPLSKQLTNLSGALWNRTLQGQRAQRIEMLLLHEFHRRKYLLPDKLPAKDRGTKARKEEIGVDEVEAPTRSKKKAQYAGGLVLEPKKGLYDKFILLLDFNSLYPSIIQEYNICFTTVSRPKDKSDEADAVQLPEPSNELAPLPAVIKNLVQKRRQVKAMMTKSKDPTQKQQLNIRQQALKLTANSMYGCLGFSSSRFFCKPLAELITAQGREILQSTVNLVQGRLGMEVVYGDTDSIMVNTGKDRLEDVMQQGQAIKKEVNKHYRLLEIDIDGVFKSLLLLKKKKYAAMKVEVLENGQVKEEMEQKGLDLVRRDWCPLSKAVGNFALKEILSGKLKEDVVMAIHEHLSEVRSKVEAGEYDLSQYVITKQLTKAPHEYPDAKSQAHVQVALRRRNECKQDGVAQGETVPYVICIPKDAEGSSLDAKSLASRAFHPEEVTEGCMEIDKMYYLAQQVHPSVSRLCAPIEGTDEARLADCLGLDSSKYRHLLQTDTREAPLVSFASFMDDNDNFKDCAPLNLVSKSGDSFSFCGVESILKGSVSCHDALAPPHCTGDESQRLSSTELSNQAILAARRFISEYYDGWIRTDDEDHTMDSRDLRIKQHKENPGRRLLNEKDLYMQLKHLHRAVDVEAACKRLSLDGHAAVKTLGEDVNRVLAQASKDVMRIRDGCQFRWVSMADLFGDLSTKQP